MTNLKDKDNEASELANELSDIPLALCQAGTYIEKYCEGYKEYLDKYKEDLELLDMEAEAGSDKTIHKTIHLNLGKIEEENKSSLNLL